MKYLALSGEYLDFTPKEEHTKFEDIPIGALFHFRARGQSWKPFLKINNIEKPSNCIYADGSDGSNWFNLDYDGHAGPLQVDNEVPMP